MTSRRSRMVPLDLQTGLEDIDAFWNEEGNARENEKQEEQSPPASASPFPPKLLSSLRKKGKKRIQPTLVSAIPPNFHFSKNDEGDSTVPLSQIKGSRAMRQVVFRNIAENLDEQINGEDFLSPSQRSIALSHVSTAAPSERSTDDDSSAMTSLGSKYNTKHTSRNLLKVVVQNVREKNMETPSNFSFSNVSTAPPSTMTRDFDTTPGTPGGHSSDDSLSRGKYSAGSGLKSDLGPLEEESTDEEEDEEDNLLSLFPGDEEVAARSPLVSQEDGALSMSSDDDDNLEDFLRGGGSGENESVTSEKTVENSLDIKEETVGKSHQLQNKSKQPTPNKLVMIPEENRTPRSLLFNMAASLLPTPPSPNDESIEAYRSEMYKDPTPSRITSPSPKNKSFKDHQSPHLLLPMPSPNITLETNMRDNRKSLSSPIPFSSPNSSDGGDRPYESFLLASPPGSELQKRTSTDTTKKNSPLSTPASKRSHNKSSISSNRDNASSPASSKLSSNKSNSPPPASPPMPSANKRDSLLPNKSFFRASPLAGLLRNHIISRETQLSHSSSKRQSPSPPPVEENAEDFFAATDGFEEEKNSTVSVEKNAEDFLVATDGFEEEKNSTVSDNTVQEGDLRSEEERDRTGSTVSEEVQGKDSRFSAADTPPGNDGNDNMSPGNDNMSLGSDRNDIMSPRIDGNDNISSGNDSMSPRIDGNDNISPVIDGNDSIPPENDDDIDLGPPENDNDVDFGPPEIDDGGEDDNSGSGFQLNDDFGPPPSPESPSFVEERLRQSRRRDSKDEKLAQMETSVDKAERENRERALAEERAEKDAKIAELEMKVAEAERRTEEALQKMNEGSPEVGYDVGTMLSPERSVEAPTVTSSTKRKRKKKLPRLPRVSPSSTPRRVRFAPAGLQAGPREFERIPVIDLCPDEDEMDSGVRRSRRAKIPPLQFWKNEKVVYGTDVNFVQQMGVDMPVVQGIEKALPTPYKARKIRRKDAESDDDDGKKRKRGQAVAEKSSPAWERFDDSVIRSKYNYNNGDSALVWEAGTQEITERKIVCYSRKMKEARLPLSSTRESSSKITGRAAQAFNIPEANDEIPGWIAGHLVLPPGGIKDAEGVGLCSQAFFIGDCQPNSIEASIADPENSEYDHATAEKFLLSKGDYFHVPPNNVYRIENHSKTSGGTLYWTIIRPRSNA